MPKRRFGVALLLPPRVAAEIDGIRRAVGDVALERIPPHVTLVPPVNVNEQKVADAVDVMRTAASATRPFRLGLGPPETFLPANPVLFLRVDGDLDVLHALRDHVFRPPLERKLSWPFHPHVTLADEATEERIAAALTGLADFRAEVTVDRVHLLEESGRSWSPVADFRFAPAAVVGRGGLEVHLDVSDLLDPDARQLVDAEWSRHHAEVGDDDQRPLVVVAREEGSVVAVAEGRTRGRLAHLSELIVGRGERDRGLGSHVLAAFLSAAADRGCTLARLRTDAGRAAEGFYRRRGWREEARFPGATAEAEIVQLVRDL